MVQLIIALICEPISVDKQESYVKLYGILELVLLSVKQIYFITEYVKCVQYGS